MWTPRLKALVSEVSARTTYGEASRLLELLGVVRIEESSAELIVGEVGQRLRAQERAAVECYQEEEEPLIAEEAKAGRLYISMDAAKAHIDAGWHDIKVGVLFTPRVDEEGRDTLGERTYVAAQEESESFGWRLYARAREWEIAGFRETVFLGDGAEYNWQIASYHFPGSLQVLDFYHASEHVWSLSRVLYGEESKEGRRWAKERVRSLREQGPGPLLRSLRRRRARNAQAKEALRLETGYFSRNRARMNYASLSKRGMLIGSGPVEAACKVVVGQRMKRSGMRWVRRGADSMLAVRTCVLNRDYARLAAVARAA
jgi:hypothetical protein